MKNSKSDSYDQNLKWKLKFGELLKKIAQDYWN